MEYFIVHVEIKCNLQKGITNENAGGLSRLLLNMITHVPEYMVNFIYTTGDLPLVQSDVAKRIQEYPMLSILDLG